MKKIKYTRASDFKEYELDVDDEFYSVVEEIHNLTNKSTPIIVSNDESKLIVIYEKGREIGERDTHSYSITISKIPYN